MKLLEFLSPPTQAAQRGGPADRIVMSSRVRLARNLAGFAFPGWAKKAERLRVCQLLRDAVERQPQMREGFAAALERIYSVAHTVDQKTMTLQYFETLKAMGASPATKFVFPMEFTSLLETFRKGGA